MRKFLLLWCIAFILVGASKTNSQEIPKVDFCELFDSYDKYEGKTVSSTALMTFSTVTRVHGDWTELYSLRCNDRDHFALPAGGSSKTWHFLDNLKDESNFVFEVKFVGRITISELLEFGDMGWTRAEIRVQKIESSKLVDSQSIKPNWDASAPLTERAERIQRDAQTFLKSLFRGPKKTEPSINAILSDDFIFAYSNQTSLKKEGYLNIESPIITPNGESSLGISSVNRNREGAIAMGTLKINRGTKNEQTFKCLMKLVLKDGFWIISSAQLN